MNPELKENVIVDGQSYVMLAKACSEYSVYLRSDDYDKFNVAENMLHEEAIAAAAMEHFYPGTEEFIEFLNSE